MAAAVVTSRLLSQDARHARYLFTGSFTDTQESAVVKVDVSALSLVDGTNGKVSITRAKWNCSGSGVVTVILGSTTVLQLSGSGETAGALSATGGANEDVKFTTAGFASGGAYQVEITVQKEAGFITVPKLLSAEVAAGDYVTGQEIPVVATFSMPVHVNGASVFEIDIDGTTVEAAVVAGSSGATITFRYPVKATDHGELTDVDLGDLLVKAGAMALYGGSPVGAAIIPASGSFSVDITDVSVNAAATVDSVALTDDHEGSYETGDIIQATVTMTKAVAVTGTPLLPITLDSGEVEAEFVGYGADQTKLIFQYLVEEGDQAEATEFDIDGDIDLNEGAMVNADAPGVDAILTLAASDTSGVEVNPE